MLAQRLFEAVGAHPLPKRGAAHAACARCARRADLAPLELRALVRVARWAGLCRPAEASAARLGRGYTFRLPPPYALALNLCHVTEQLQNDVGYERACDPGRRPARRPRVEQGHIENRDVGADIVREMAPLVENIGVASPQTIDARYHEEISAREVAHHALPLRTLKRGARKVIDIDVLFGNRKRPQRVQLPVYVLVARGYARIAKRRHRFHLFAPARRGIYTNICTIKRGADTYTKKRDLPTGTTRYSG